MTEREESPAPAGGRFRAEALAAAVCVGVGLALAVAPHVATLVVYGTPEYLADGDDVFYLSVARIPYRGELTLRDPFCGPWEPRPSLYSWLQFVPPALLTRALGLGPLLVALVWRVGGGMLLGLTLYALFRRLLADTRHTRAWALGATLVCLADAGFVDGKTLVGDAFLARHWLHGTTPLTSPKSLGQYRVVTPLTNLAALIALAAVLVPPLSGRRTPAAAVAGMAALGLCVYLYFFYWTAAAAALGLYLAGVAFAWWLGRPSAQRARTEFVFAGAVLVGGLALGAPQVITNSRAFADPEFKPILQRMSRGVKLPPGHPACYHNVRNAWLFAKLAFGAVVLMAFAASAKAPRGAVIGLAVLLAFTVAGYLLANNAVVTGLEFENFHWVYVYSPFSEVALLTGLAVLLARFQPLPRPASLALGAVPVVLTLFALAWRPYEAFHAPEAVTLNRTLRDLAPLRPALAKLGPTDILAGPMEVNVALLGGFSGLLYQFDQTSVSSTIPDIEVHERHALNAWLNGLSLDDYVVETRRVKFPGGEIVDPSWLPNAVTAARVAIFRDLLDGRADDLLARYRPNVLLRATADGPPPRGGPWTRVDAPAGVWSLWTRPDTAR